MAKYIRENTQQTAIQLSTLTSSSRQKKEERSCWPKRYLNFLGRRIKITAAKTNFCSCGICVARNITDFQGTISQYTNKTARTTPKPISFSTTTTQTSKKQVLQCQTPNSSEPACRYLKASAFSLTKRSCTEISKKTTSSSTINLMSNLQILGRAAAAIMMPNKRDKGDTLRPLTTCVRFYYIGSDVHARLLLAL